MGLFGKGGIFGGGLLGGGLFGGGGGSLGKFIISESKIPSIDLPERVKERNRESSNPLVQTVQAIDDAREEAKEIMTDGVVEMVFKGNEDYQTSFEKREKADRIIQQERSKYNRACEQVNQEIAALNAHIEESQRRKRKLLQGIRSKLSVQSIGISGIFQNNFSVPEMQFQGFLDMAFDSLLGKTSADARKESADAYLEDARDYRVQVSGKIAELHSVSAKIACVETILTEERTLLDGLEKSLAVNRSLEYAQIARKLQVLVSTYIIEQTGNPNSVYQKTLDELKTLCPKF